jgi:hypothetical protein
MIYDLKERVIAASIMLALIGGASTGFYFLDRKEETNHMRKNVETILDVNQDSKLSDSEISRFYSETGLSPFSYPFKTLSRADLERFLKNYEQRWVRKNPERR